MKKATIGLAALAAAVALRPIVKRRMVQKMREHCKQMMSEFAGGSETTSHGVGPKAMPQKMREHCTQIAAQRDERGEPVATA